MIIPPEHLHNIWRFSPQGWQEIPNRVIGETNVTLSINGEEWLTFACTPTNLEALGIGFLYNEGFIQNMGDVAVVKACENGCNLDIWLNKPAERPKQWRRTSGCTGGVTSAQAVPEASFAADLSSFSPESILNAMDQLLEVQSLYRDTRGVHCSALSDGQSIRYQAEDIGRHNTLDKLAGQLLLNPENLPNRMVITTGRISAEMLQKTARLKASLVVSRTSPTSLSIEKAQELGITLVGYTRHNQFNVYTHPERIFSGSTA